MSENDKNLLSQMVSAGRFNFEIVELLRKKQAHDSLEMISQMGEKYCCHPKNSPNKLGAK
jgi:hypothetical protein